MEEGKGWRRIDVGYVRGGVEKRNKEKTRSGQEKGREREREREKVLVGWEGPRRVPDAYAFRDNRSSEQYRTAFTNTLPGSLNT